MQKKQNARWSRTLHDCLSQDAAVQPGAGETGLLRAGGQELSVSGGVPQGLHGDRSQTSLAQRMDADQVPSFSSSGLFIPHKNVFFVFIYTYIFVCPTGFYSKRALWLMVTSQATRELCLSCLVFFLSCFEVRFFDYYFF